MALPNERAARYQMGPRSTRGLIAGWRTGQIIFVAVGLVLAVGVLRSIGGVEGAFLGLLVVSGAVGAATWPIGGRSLEQWIPTVATFVARAVAAGRYRPWHSTGSVPSAGSSSCGPLSRLSLFQLDTTGIGVIGDSEAGTWSSVVPVGGAGFALLDDAARASRIAAWSGVLAAMAREGSGLHRIQWVARSCPAHLEPSSLGDGAPDGGRPSALGGSAESYCQLVDEIAPVLWSHEVFIAVTVRAGPRSFSKPAFGRRRPADDASAGGRRPSREAVVAARAPESNRRARAKRRPPAAAALPASKAKSAAPAGTAATPLPAAAPLPAPKPQRRRRSEAKRLEAERREAERRKWRERSASIDLADRSGYGKHFRQVPQPVEVVPPSSHSADVGAAKSTRSPNAGCPEPTAPARKQDAIRPAGGRGEMPPTTGKRDAPRVTRRSADPATSLRRQLASLVERLQGAGLRCGPPLSTSQLAATLRRNFEAAPASDVMPRPWPVAIAEAWTSLRTDASWQAVYWIAEWPRSEVGTTFMLPLLLSARIRRTISVTMAPLPSFAAVRRAERERTSGSADAELRRRHGFVVSARARREQEARLQREAELAEGHAGYRFSGYVTVTGHDADDLEQSCARIEQDAALAQLELRRLYGAQAEAFCCSLPIGRGCR